ncbi:hypothetical protein HMN09_01379300 [Mycena chlorophos]|uniref:Uncharacterized protein n=1 Tax=Mycena chlorophos TaxID=658473 RepID=A0A8H6RXI1_MYCCL|nr:hypothetical protein HMN09_01379300 [Mycena chlorophos]
MSLRQRIPFQDDEEDRSHSTQVLDETEQEELIEDLRRENLQTSARAVVMLDGVLAFSTLLQVVYLLKQSRMSPLFELFPPSATTSLEPIPAPVLFTVLALLLHANLVLHLHPALTSSSSLPLPLPYATTYALGCVAPTLGLFLARAWQTTLWTSLPVLVVLLVQSVHDTLKEGDEALAELETLKYTAPGP